MQIEALPPQKVAVRYQTVLAAGIEFLIALFVLVVYTVLHESGHALVGLAFGGTITAFNTNFLNLTAHVGIEGNFSILQQCLVAVAGVSFPLPSPSRMELMSTVVALNVAVLTIATVRSPFFL